MNISRNSLQLRFRKAVSYMKTKTGVSIHTWVKTGNCTTL